MFAQFKTFISFDCAIKSLAFTCMTVNVQIVKCINQVTESTRAALIQKYNLAPHTSLQIAMATALKAPDDELIACLLTSYKKLEFLAGTFITVHKSGVYDIISGMNIKEVNLIFKTHCLKQTLDNLNIDLANILAVKNKLLALGSKIFDSELVTIDELYITCLVENQPVNLNKNSTSVQDQILMYYSCLTYALPFKVNYELALINPTEKNKLYVDDSLVYEKFLLKYSNSYLANKAHAKANFLKIVADFSLQFMLLGVDKSNIKDLADSFMQVLSFGLHSGQWPKHSAPKK